MKVWVTPNQALDPAAPLEAEAGLVSPIAHGSVRTREERGPHAMHWALRRAVRAYARDPSERNAVMVEGIIAELRQHGQALRD